MPYNSFVFASTIDDIIRRAFRIIGINNEYTGEQYSQARDVLSMIVNRINSVGLNLWKLKEAVQAISTNDQVLHEGISYVCIKDNYSSDYTKPGTDTGKLYWVEGGLSTTAWEAGQNYSTPIKTVVTLPAVLIDKIKLVEKGSFSDIKIIPKNCFMDLDPKVLGTPTQAWVEYITNSQEISPTIHLHPTPTTENLQMCFWYVEILNTPSGGKNYPDFPPQWQEVLVFGLAAELAYEHGANNDSIVILERKAASAYEMARKGNFERNDCHTVKPRF